VPGPPVGRDRGEPEQVVFFVPIVRRRTICPVEKEWNYAERSESREGRHDFLIRSQVSIWPRLPGRQAQGASLPVHAGRRRATILLYLQPEAGLPGTPAASVRRVLRVRREFLVVRLSGKVVFSKDLGLKARIHDASPIVKSIYQTPDNPAFEIFYLEGTVATIADFSGNPPQTFRL